VGRSLDARDARLLLTAGATEITRMAAYPSRPPAAHTSLRVLRGLGDEELTQLVATGNEPAFAVIYDRYMPALLRYCRRILGSADDAEDAAQAAMVQAMRGLGRRPPRHLRPWLYRIAHNEAISLARKHGRSSESPLDDGQADTATDPEQAAVTRARLAQLLADLHALPGRQRDALVMRELCGRSYADIAAELGSSEAAVAQTVFEARLSLHEFGEGRELDCLEIQRSISACDHGRLRTRRVRAHLRACECCSAFERDLYARRRDFALLLPWVSATTVPEILGLAGGGGAARMLTRLLRVPLPPGGLRGAAIAALAAALGATGLGLQAVSGSPRHRVVAAATRADMSFSSPGDRPSPTARGGANGTATAPGGRAGGHAPKLSPAPAATEGGQTRVPPSVDPGAGGAAPSPAHGGQPPTGGGAPPGVPTQAPPAGQALGTAQALGTGAVKGVAGTVDGATQSLQSAGASAGQTVAGATDAVGSGTQSATGAVKQVVGSLP
jgi:RNA polymerase sigma factor (sigma-70 family)